MAAGTWTIYDSFLEYSMDGTIDLDADTFKCALVTSSYTPNAATHSAWSDVSANEVANGNGYTTGGVTLTSVTWTQSAGTATFDSADPSWTASGGSITARYAVLYDDTVATPVVDALVAYLLLDTTPADVTATDGADLTIVLPSGGYFQLTEA